MSYVPICKDPRRFMFLFGPLGFQKVEEVRECPILIREVGVRQYVEVSDVCTIVCDAPP